MKIKYYWYASILILQGWNLVHAALECPEGRIEYHKTGILCCYEKQTTECYKIISPKVPVARDTERTIIPILLSTLRNLVDAFGRTIYQPRETSQTGGRRRMESQNITQQGVRSSVGGQPKGFTPGPNGRVPVYALANLIPDLTNTVIQTLPGPGGNRAPLRAYMRRILNELSGVTPVKKT